MDLQTRLIVNSAVVVILLGVCILCVALHIRKVKRTRMTEMRKRHEIPFFISWMLMGGALAALLRDLGLSDTFTGLIGIPAWLALLWFSDRIIKKKTKSIKEEEELMRFGPWG